MDQVVENDVLPVFLSPIVMIEHFEIIILKTAGSSILKNISEEPAAFVEDLDSDSSFFRFI